MEALWFWAAIFGIWLIYTIIVNIDKILLTIFEFLFELLKIILLYASIPLGLYFLIVLSKEFGFINVLGILVLVGIAAGLIYYKDIVNNFIKKIRDMLINRLHKIKVFLVPPPLEKPKLKSRYVAQALILDKDAAINNEPILTLLKHGANINAKDENGNTILHKLVEKNKINAASFILKNGARLDLKNNNGLTPVDIVKSGDMKDYLDPNHAIYSRDYERVKLLLHAKAPIPQDALLIASTVGNKLMFTLVAEHIEDLDYKDKDGNTALMQAVRYSHPSIVQWLLENNADVDSKTNSGQTVMHIATMYGYDEMIKVLIEHGVKVDVKDNAGRTPLWYAKKYGNTSTFNLLKSYSRTYYLKRILLWLAIIGLSAGVIWGILHYPNSVKNKFYEYAIEYGYFNVADFLAETSSDTADNRYNLKKAIIDGDASLNNVRYYLDKNDKDLNIQDQEGKTILHHAFEHAKADVIKELIARGADTSIRDKNRRTPCFYGVYNPHKDTPDCDETMDKGE